MKITTAITNLKGRSERAVVASIDEGDIPNEVALSEERLLPSQAFTSRTLLRQRSLDLGELLHDLPRVHRPLPEVRERLDRLISAVLGREPTRRLLDGEETEEHDRVRDNLETEGETPDDGAGSREVKRDAVVEEVGDENTGGDPDLEQTGDTTANILGRALGDEGWCDCGDATDTDAGDDAAPVNVGESTGATSHCSEDLESKFSGHIFFSTYIPAD
jgi:hypothetical protein